MKLHQLYNLNDKIYQFTVNNWIQIDLRTNLQSNLEISLRKIQRRLSH